MTLSAAESAELDRLVHEQADDLEWLDRMDRQYPLATSVLWSAPAAACDQRRAVAAAMRAPTIGVILGGERSGKSKGAKDWTLASALGGDHPVTQAWLDLNGLPRDLIPDGPAEMYAVALRSGDSVRYHRPDFASMVGSLPHSWNNKNGKGEASLTLHVAGYAKPGKIHFMAVDQGPDAMQGISLRGAWIDEEPLGEKGKAVYKHLRGRVADQDGRIIVTMVPTEGFTWFHDDFIRDGKDDVIILELDTLDNPHLPRERFLRHFAGMDADELAQRRFGRFRSRSGAIYTTFNSGDLDRWGMGHVCAPFDIPPGWTRFRGGDFGLVNPTCILWGALDDDDTLYIYREFYRGNNESYPWLAEQVGPMERGESIEMGWGDPSAKEGREAFCSHDIMMATGDNDLTTGYARIKERLRLQGDNRPRIKIFATCTNLIREMRGLVWDPNRVDRVQLKKDDHSCDALRYLCMGLEQWKGL